MKVILTAQGGMRMLHNDQIDIKKFGTIKINRASHIEYNNNKQCWEVMLPKKWYQFFKKYGNVIKTNLTSRQDALKWEHENSHLL